MTNNELMKEIKDLTALIKSLEVSTPDLESLDVLVTTAEELCDKVYDVSKDLCSFYADLENLRDSLI